jgi:hypothetical protein
MPASLEHKERVLRHQLAIVQVASVRDWNALYEIGTDVTFYRDFGGPLHTTTCSRAQMLNGHTAVVFLEGIASPVALERVSARGK